MGEKQVASQALYLKYRSQTLDDVIGQSHITETLKRAIENNRISHAYLFTGPRGVGKTSVARILAHAITGLQYDESATYPDIIEIDAASNRRIDDIRDLRDKVQIAPTQAPYKVYIIDEVHMLTGESFNAFLKTLEEPPEHVVFIMATTDAHKLPLTVTSRAQQFKFRAIDTDSAVQHLATIAKRESINVTDSALRLIAEHGDGSFRDSISLLDQLANLSVSDQAIDETLVGEVLGLASHDLLNSLLTAYAEHDTRSLISLTSEIARAGIQPSTIANQLIRLGVDRLSAQPELSSLLNQLIDVASSPRPDVKLLLALIPAQSPSIHSRQDKIADNKPRTSSQLKTNSTDPEEVVQAPTKQLKSADLATAKNTASQTLTVATSEKKPVEYKLEEDSSSAVNEPTDDKLSWENLLRHAKSTQLALYSILNKCAGVVSDDTVTVYTGTDFWKNRLDSTKYHELLKTLIGELATNHYKIQTIAKHKPPADEKLAAIAAMMGGGEEVSIESGAINDKKD